MLPGCICWVRLYCLDCRSIFATLWPLQFNRMKDNFSAHADAYAKFRPGYPPELFDWIRSNVDNQENCWDCGTGSGQIAGKLAEFFDSVYATDISKRQLAHAVQADNIHYSVQPAEQTDFPDDHFDLVTVGQAIHWFDFERFYAEVRRTARAHALVVVVGYGLTQIDPGVDAVIRYLYKDIVGPYWDPERKHIEDGYRTIPFPFQEINVPELTISYHWTVDQLTAYLRTWSAVQHYIRSEEADPVALIEEDLRKTWTSGLTKRVVFPLLARVGHVHG